MALESSPAARSAVDDAWRQIETLVDDLTRLAQRPVAEGEFYPAFLNAAVRAGAARGGAVWSVEASGDLRLECHADCAPLLEAGESAPGHTAWLHAARDSGQIQSVAPRAGMRDRVVNPTDALLVVCPVLRDGRVLGLLEILQRPDISPDALCTYQELLTTLCATAADYLRHCELRRLRAREDTWNRTERFAELAHAQLDLEVTAFTVVNEGRQIAGCDRLSLALRRGAVYFLETISGVATFQRRANPVRYAEQLVGLAAATGEPLWVDGAAPDVAPPIAQALQLYVDEAHVRTLAVIPLHAPQSSVDSTAPREPPLGALVFEWFDAVRWDAERRERVHAVCRHAATAVANARRHSRIPWVRVWQRLDGLTGRRCWPQWVVGGLVVVALATVLSCVPADFTIPCRGRLQPQTQRRVFAPCDGRVEQLPVRHGDRVTEGQTLAALVSPDLDLASTRVWGELQTAEEQLRAVQASRLSTQPTTAEKRDEYARLTADEERLKKLLANLHEQKTILDEQRVGLRIASPIAGQVLTWEVAEQLEARPVKRGQALLTVADTDGPWTLELRVPDKHIGYVRDAQQEVQEHLAVTFVLATEPGQSYTGRVGHVALVTEADELKELFVTVTVAIDGQQELPRHPGAEVRARIACGRRSLGFVWLYDLLAAVRRWTFF
jgi:multidrug efflux pump subunit AcrA (membrane-fusion protein)